MTTSRAPLDEDTLEQPYAGRIVETRTTAGIEIVHVLRQGEPKCPKCGKGLESEGGSVFQAGQWDWGPLWWECADDGEQWGHA